MHYGVTKDHGTGCHGNQTVALLPEMGLFWPILKVLWCVT